MALQRTLRILNRRNKRVGPIVRPAAPTLARTSGDADRTPVFTLTYSAQEGDVLYIERSTSSTFATSVYAIATATGSGNHSIDIGWGALWSATTYYTRAWYVRVGIVSMISSTVTFTLT